MEFGCFFTMQSPDMRTSSEIYQRGAELVLAAEECGFTGAWLAEHHFTSYSYLSSPITFLANLAARTKTIRLGTAITPLPMHNPLLIAEQMATLDVLSDGRVNVGLGKGYQHYQFERLGIGSDICMEHYKESVELVCKALEGKPFEFSGDHFQVPETIIFPQPLQTKPPVWVVVNTSVAESVEFALERNLNVFTGVLEPFSKLKNIESAFPELVSRAGGARIGTHRPVFVSDSKREIKRALDEVRWNARVSVSQRFDFGEVDGGRVVEVPFEGEPDDERMLEDYVIFGSPEHCIEKIKHLQDELSCDHFNASFWFGRLDQTSVLKSMKAFSEHVMPAF